MKSPPRPSRDVDIDDVITVGLALGVIKLSDIRVKFDAQGRPVTLSVIPALPETEPCAED